MRKVYSSPKTNLVHFAKSVLEANNIETAIAHLDCISPVFLQGLF